jgi:hypothetical protein
MFPPFNVVIQVLKAKNPMGNKCVDVEHMVHKVGLTKHIGFLLNKISIFSPTWLNHLFSLNYS